MTKELSALDGLKSMYNVVATLGPSFQIESSSFLQVTRTAIKSCMSSNSVRSDHDLRSYLPLRVLKNPHRLIIRETLWPL